MRKQKRSLAKRARLFAKYTSERERERANKSCSIRSKQSINYCISEKFVKLSAHYTFIDHNCRIHKFRSIHSNFYNFESLDNDSSSSNDDWIVLDNSP